MEQLENIFIKSNEFIIILKKIHVTFEMLTMQLIFFNFVNKNITLLSCPPYTAPLGKQIVDKEKFLFREVV